MQQGQIGRGVGALEPMDGRQALGIGAVAESAQGFDVGGVECIPDRLRNRLPGDAAGALALREQPGEMGKNGAVEDDGKRFETAAEPDSGDRSSGDRGAIQQGSQEGRRHQGHIDREK